MTGPRTLRGLYLGALAVAPLALAGCAAGGGTTTPAAASAPATAPASTGVAVAGTTAGVHEATAAAPPETATMVCGEDIRTKVAQALQLPAPPRTADSWAAPVYTCTYSLPMGPMVLTVTVAPDKATAGRDFEAFPGTHPGSTPMAGLGERAQGTADGTVEVLKDNQLLTVDTTRLPAVFGAQQQRRTDLAYEVASDVLGCWTGDE